MTNPTRREFLQRSAGVAAGMVLGGVAGNLLAEELNGPFRPRFSFCNETFVGSTLEQACAATAKAGYQGIEIAPFTLAGRITEIDATRRRSLRKDAEKAGLAVAGLHWLLAKTEGFHLTSADEEERARTADYLVELARFCGELGGGVMVFGSPKQRDLRPGVSTEQAYGYAREVIQRTLPELEKSGVVLAIEPLAPKTTTFINTAADGKKLVDMVGSKWCRLILDCVAMSKEDKPIPELLRENIGQLAHFHANDPNGRGPGFGKLDFRPILATLRELRYPGWISVEVFDYSPGAERLAVESLKYLRESLAEGKGDRS